MVCQRARQAACLLAAFGVSLTLTAQAGARVTHASIALPRKQPFSGHRLVMRKPFKLAVRWHGLGAGDRVFVEWEVLSKWYLSSDSVRLAHPRNGTTQHIRMRSVLYGTRVMALAVKRHGHIIAVSRRFSLNFYEPKMPKLPPGFDSGSPDAPPGAPVDGPPATPPTLPPGVSSGSGPGSSPGNPSSGPPPGNPSGPPVGAVRRTSGLSTMPPAFAHSATLRSTYSPSLVGCGGTLGGEHLWRNEIDVEPQVVVNYGQQAWAYQANLFRFTNNNWVLISKGPGLAAIVYPPVANNIITVGDAVEGTALPNTYFTVNTTAYYYVTIQYVYQTLQGTWAAAAENQANFMQYTQAYPNGFASNYCEAYADPDGRY